LGRPVFHSGAGVLRPRGGEDSNSENNERNCLRQRTAATGATGGGERPARLTRRNIGDKVVAKMRSASGGFHFSLSSYAEAGAVMAGPFRVSQG
jgi:hypothetical protein